MDSTEPNQNDVYRFPNGFRICIAPSSILSMARTVNTQKTHELNDQLQVRHTHTNRNKLLCT